LLEVLNRLVELGNTVLVIEHNLDVIKSADWIIDLGPEGGDAGGEIVAEGTPEQVAAHPRSHTGAALRPLLAMQVLIVEDEQRLAENLARGLRENAGYAVDIALDGGQGLFLAETSDYDLIILDLMLPKLDGADVLRRLRAAGRTVPVLILTARDETESVIALLNAGADDYVAKPFDLGEFLARAKALIRRGKGRPAPVLRLGGLEINTAQRSVRRHGAAVALTPMEYRVLEYLAHRASEVVSKEELLEHLYDYNWEKFSNVIEVYISGLRRKLDGGPGPKLIQTLRGHGYMLRGEES
jgi:two-component system response regulator PhoP